MMLSHTQHINHYTREAQCVSIVTFDEMRFLRKYTFHTSGNCLYQNSNAKSTKVAKIEVANTQLPVWFKHFFLFFLNIVHFAYARF